MLSSWRASWLLACSVLRVSDSGMTSHMLLACCHTRMKISRRWSARGARSWRRVHEMSDMRRWWPGRLWAEMCSFLLGVLFICELSVILFSYLLVHEPTRRAHRGTSYFSLQNLSHVSIAARRTHSRGQATLSERDIACTFLSRRSAQGARCPSTPAARQSGVSESSAAARMRGMSCTPCAHSPVMEGINVVRTTADGQDT